MAAHEDITDRSSHTIDLSGSTATARGVNGPKYATMATIYAPASAVCYVQVGTSVVDGTTDLSTDGLPLPPGVQTAFPCSVNDAPGNATGRPTIYLQGDADVTVRFTGSGLA